MQTGAYEASSYIDNVMQTYIDAPWTFEVVGKTPLQQIWRQKNDKK